MSKLPENLHGVWASAGTIAGVIHAGRLVESHFEDLLCDLWPDLDHLGTDYYDNSLEVYFETHSPTDNEATLDATPEQQQVVGDAGFDRFWLNFKGGRHAEGGSERAYVNPEWLRLVAERTAALKADSKE